MVASLARRGPDGQGIECWPDAVLGHRRLSIFDLSDAGRQPMLTPDRTAGVVFNGAIYNFQDLRRELEASGFAFRSNTDTEVLLHGYTAWGIDRLVARLRGMFAFVLWDEKRQTACLVRDRLGVKPLIYSISNGRLAFASTPRALRAGGVVDEIDPQAVAEFFEFGFIPDPRTIYAGAKKVPAATIVEWSGGKLSERVYWRPEEAREQGPSFEEAVEETERIFLRAVELRLEADVPVGALLSGGIDSSLVCWAIAKLNADITAFTVATPGDAWDESSDARQTARELGIRHEVIESSPAQAPGPEQLADAYGEPFACASALGMLGVSEQVRRSATVLLTGDGGDDVFLGYPEHGHFWKAQRLAAHLPPGSAGLWKSVRRLVPRAGILRRAVHFADYAFGGLGAVASAHPGLPIYRREGILGERLREARIAQREMAWSLERGRKVLSEFLEYDRRMRFVGEYMTKVDGGAMYHALEARSPFLDQELWTFASALPLRVRLEGGRLKAVLRELARRRLGERVASGRKRGFGIPVQKWIAGKWRAQWEAAMRESMLERDGWIRAGAALDWMSRTPEGSQAPMQLWYLFVLENWLRREAGGRN